MSDTKAAAASLRACYTGISVTIHATSQSVDEGGKSLCGRFWSERLPESFASHLEHPVTSWYCKRCAQLAGLAPATPRPAPRVAPCDLIMATGPTSVQQPIKRKTVENLMWGLMEDHDYPETSNALVKRLTEAVMRELGKAG